jgi:hypothetical protein
MRIFIRNVNYAVKHPKRTWAVRKACRDHVRRFPRCEWCDGTKGVEAHHIVPLWEDDTLGALPTNFISLCRRRRCHLLIGHNGDFARRYVENVDEICMNKKVRHRQPLTVVPMAEMAVCAV